MSWINWLDYSSEERERVLELLATPKDKGTLDELGVGTVRDAIADHLFPPLNTIQTRAKYFLFVPWIYRQLEQGNVADERLPGTGANRERALIEALLSSDCPDKDGLLGKEARGELKRLPSSIYWSGLRRLGIFCDGSSLSEYLHEIRDIRHHGRQRARDALEVSVEPGRATATSWDLGLPEDEPNFLKTSHFGLTSPQASYLREKTLAMATPSGRACLLQWLLENAPVASTQALRSPWDLLGEPAAGRLPAPLRNDLVHARNFSACVQGLTTLYYAFLGQALQMDPQPHRDALARWSDSLRSWSTDLCAWHEDIEAFWSWVRLANPRLQRDAPFLGEWLALLARQRFAPAGPDALLTPDLHRLLLHRERALKGALARLSNPGPLSRWKHAVDGNLLTYRWPTAQQFLVDVRAGLGVTNA
jgi:hypothetical protein